MIRIGGRVTEELDALRSTLEGRPFDEVMATRLYLSQYIELHTQVCELRRVAGDRVLDWGAGYGHFAFVQAGLGAKVTAFTPPLDDYTEFVGILNHLAEQRSFASLVGNPLEGLPLEDASQDLVVSIGVLEHVGENGDDEARAVQDVRRVLRTGGLFFVAHLPQEHSAIERINRASGRTHHSRLFSRTELVALMKSNGFEEVGYGVYGLLPVSQLATTRLGSKTKWAACLAYRQLDSLLCRVFGRWAQNQVGVFRAC
jgi:SAM-dependent methyltransferase